MDRKELYDKLDRADARYVEKFGETIPMMVGMELSIEEQIEIMDRAVRTGIRFDPEKDYKLRDGEIY